MIIALYRLSYSVEDAGRARTCDHDLKWENLREYEKPLVRSTRSEQESNPCHNPLKMLLYH